MSAFAEYLKSPAETDRLAAVRRYDVLDSPPDGSFDRITAIAARQFNVPISIISIVDENRIWFKSHHGLPINQINRDEGLCATTIMSAYPRVLNDAKEDSCALVNPLVAGDFGLRFYAGAPLTTHDGYNLGTLCVIDTAPRPVRQEQIDDLVDLAAVVVDELELRISALRAVEREQLLAKEIDHRVMNSLQFISSLLTMQSMTPQSADAASQLQIAANRVATVAQVHRNFYSNAAAYVSCLTFLHRLAVDLSGIIGKPVDVRGDEGLVPTNLIQPIGLMASEMIANAAKHGKGRIALSYQMGGGLGVLQVCNDGDALPAGFDPNRPSGLGMRVITSLATQLRGRLEARPGANGSGACFTVTFPV